MKIVRRILYKIRSAFWTAYKPKIYLDFGSEPSTTAYGLMTYNRDLGTWVYKQLTDDEARKLIDPTYETI